MDTKKVLTHLIRAGRDALHREKTLKEIGYRDTPYFDLYGEIADAIYCMLGEETDSFDESITHAALQDIYTSDEVCAENLASICDESSGIMDDIPVSTRKVIEETAKERKIDPQKLIVLILSDWARKEVVFQLTFK